MKKKLTALEAKIEAQKIAFSPIVFQATIKEVNNQGRLITVDTMEREFNSGEIKWVLDE